jgi:hypothetical protein
MLLGAATRDDDAVGVTPQARRSVAAFAERAAHSPASNFVPELAARYAGQH